MHADCFNRYLEEMRSYKPASGFVRAVPRIRDTVSSSDSFDGSSKEPFSSKRPRTAYNAFIDQEHLHLTEAEHVSTELLVEMSKGLGLRWRSMSSEEAQLYADFEAANQKYQYKMHHEARRHSSATIITPTASTDSLI